jgi:hypothetical protein
MMTSLSLSLPPTHIIIINALGGHVEGKPISTFLFFSIFVIISAWVIMVSLVFMHRYCLHVCICALAHRVYSQIIINK